jgi:exodeoxyribonuclease VII large subunit
VWRCNNAKNLGFLRFFYNALHRTFHRTFYRAFSPLETNPTLLSALTVSELNASVASLLADSLPMLRVRGEAQGVKRYPSGHVYFSLKDANASVSCVMFKMRAQLFDRLPREGELIELRAKATLYEPRGDYQLRVDGWQPAGQGALYEAFLQLKAKLEHEGLLDANRKRTVPTFVSTVGIVTSLQAAVLRDVATALTRRAPHVRLIVYPSAVQGAAAGAALAAAVQRASEHGEADVLLVCRGGGSMEDLWCFNDEALARAIVQCNMPVISGVGHETDFTIADFVADVRAPTPTAAAELCTMPTQEWLDELASFHANLHAAAHDLIALQGQTLDRLNARLTAASPRAQLSLQSSQIHSLQLRLRHAAQRSAVIHAQRLSALANRLAPTVTALLRQHRGKLNTLDAQLHALSPQRVLERGYAVVLDAQGKALLAPAPAGEVVTLHLAQRSQSAVLQ